MELNWGELPMFGNSHSLWRWLRRPVIVVVSALTALLATGLVAAHADTADPVLPFHASVSLNGSGDPVLTLTGGWQWTTHHSNCNLDRYAAGWAVDWNDPNQAGNVVGTVNSVSVDVGAAAANSLNPADDNVHFDHLASDPTNPQNDPVAATRCGTYDPIAGYNSGTWGPISHTYAPGTTTFNTCVVMYDMHLQGMSGLQNGDDIAGGNHHNGDNSVQGNGGTPLGNQCFTFFIPTITTQTSSANVAPGANFHDTATLTGLDPAHLPPAGTITFTLHSGLDAADPNGCGATVGSAHSVVVGNIGTVGSPIYGAVSPDVNQSATGTYYWQASYSGDSHNAAVDGKCTDAHESTAITVAQPAIATSVNHASVQVGDSVKDTATLSSYSSTAAPSGNIDFKVYSSTNGTGNHCGTLITDLGNVAVSKLSSGPDVYGAVSPPYTTAGAGDIYWEADYLGDTNNLAVDGNCNDSGEHSTVNLATPGIPTVAVTGVNVGQDISDQATLTGINPNEIPPTGTITFSLYSTTTGSGNHCGTAVAGYTADVENIVKISSGPDVYGANSTTYTTTAAGNYFWLAVYSGDTYNAPVSGKCDDANETSGVALTQPSISTVADANATVGDSVTDTATLGGLTAGNPTGTITFSLYSSLDPLSPTGCGIQVGSSVQSSVGALVGGGFGATSPGIQVTSPGKYYWLASYGGDGHYAAASGKCSDTNEESDVALASPGIGTSAGASVQIGTPVTDTATVTGGFNPTGTVTFTIYANSNCTTQISPAFVVTDPLVAGAATSDPYTPTSTQELWWGAVYNGDLNNNSANESCTAANEQTTVTPLNPTLTTSATPVLAIPDPAIGGPVGTIQDLATLHGSTPDAGGTVTFELFGPVSTNAPTCTTLVTSETVGVNDNVVAGTVTALATPVPVTQAGYYFWEASYSGDPNNSPFGLTGCGDAGETTQVTMPALSLQKSGVTNGSNPTSPLVLPGQQISYTVTIPNTGNADVDDATITDTLPAYVDVNTGSISNGGVFTAGPTLSVSAGTIVWTGIDIDAHTTVTLTYTVTVDSSVPQGEILTNLVQLGTLSASTQHQVPSGNLSITKAVDKTTANYGDTLTYTLHVTANGNLDEHNVVLKDYIPGYDPAQPASGKTTYVAGSAACSGSGTCTTGYDSTLHQVSWNIGTLPAGTSRDVTFQVTIDSPTPAADGSIPSEIIYNAGSVSSNENPSSVPSNVVQTQVGAVPPLTGAVSVSKAVDKTAANYGDTLTYTLHVTATGGLVQHDVTVTDIIPGYDPSQPNSGKTTYVDGSATCVGPGTCTVTYDASSHTITWDVGTMTGGDTRDVTFQVTVDTPAPASDGSIPTEHVDNVAVVGSTENPTVSPSNVVHTVIGAVLGESRHQRHTPATLPFTGIPAADMNWLGAGLLSIGVALQGVRRRRSRRRHAR